MTKEEKLIVSAYTGFLMCDFADLHKYVEERLGRPIWTHELADQKVEQELKNAVKADFIELCKSDSAE